MDSKKIIPDYERDFEATGKDLPIKKVLVSPEGTSPDIPKGTDVKEIVLDTKIYGEEKPSRRVFKVRVVNE